MNSKCSHWNILGSFLVLGAWRIWDRRYLMWFYHRFSHMKYKWESEYTNCMNECVTIIFFGCDMYNFGAHTRTHNLSFFSLKIRNDSIHLKWWWSKFTRKMIYIIIYVYHTAQIINNLIFRLNSIKRNQYCFPIWLFYRTIETLIVNIVSISRAHIY